MQPDSGGIVESLRTGLDEDEAAAKANVSPLPYSTTGEWRFIADERGMQVRDAGNDTLIVRHTWPNEGEHIARHDPDRVLARVAAERQIAALHQPAGRYVYRDDGTEACGTCGDYTVEWPCPTLRLLALPYNRHGDSREEWRPA